MSLGALMLDVAGLILTENEKQLLQQPQVGGLILFSRNFESVKQVRELIVEIRQCRPNIIIAVDQEGGRVQRFREGLTRLPSMALFGRMYAEDSTSALGQAEACGWLMATEILALGIDISFAPVLDLDLGVSEVIGDRAFHSDPHVIAKVADAFICGMRSAGMAATGKHFPGHGAVAADSHVAVPVDHRNGDEILANDVYPFAVLSSMLAGVMPAHVIYPKVCDKPAGFSSHWLQKILRQQLRFDGVIFSDDLTMEGASVAGGYAERAQAALEAGCDMVLVCNQPESAKEVLAWLSENAELPNQKRMQQLQGQSCYNWEQLQDSPRWKQTRENLQRLMTEELTV